MVAGEFQVLYEHYSGVTLLRNFLKLRKKRKLAEERGESSLTATLEKSDDGRVIRTEVGTVQSDSNPRAAEQDDWRQVCPSPILCLYH